jgi:hypothetical protein
MWRTGSEEGKQGGDRQGTRLLLEGPEAMKYNAESFCIDIRALHNGFSEEGLVAVLLGSDKYFVSSTD